MDSPGGAHAPGWPERIALTIAIVLFVGVALWMMWRFWRRPGRGQHDLPVLPTPPADLGNALAGPFEGRYLATTLPDDDSQRLVVHGLGVAGAALLAVTDAGVYLERTGLPGLFLPAETLRAARVEQAPVGTAYGYGALGCRSLDARPPHARHGLSRHATATSRRRRRCG